MKISIEKVLNGYVVKAEELTPAFSRVAASFEEAIAKVHELEGVIRDTFWREDRLDS